MNTPFSIRGQFAEWPEIPVQALGTDYHRRSLLPGGRNKSSDAHEQGRIVTVRYKNDLFQARASRLGGIDVRAAGDPEAEWYPVDETVYYHRAALRESIRAARTALEAQGVKIKPVIAPAKSRIPKKGTGCGPITPVNARYVRGVMRKSREAFASIPLSGSSWDGAVVRKL